MPAVPQRLGIKLNLKQKPRRQPQHIVPIFQRWIQEHTVEGMLIDVIDYKHVPAGPGVVLIADEADYAYDLADGQIGLQYIRKRALPADFAAALRLTFHCALTAAQVLEAEAPGDLVFDYQAAKISFFDRMRYRNEPEIFAQVRPALAQILAEIYAAPVEIRQLHEDPRRIFALRVEALAPVDVAALGARLQAQRQLA